MLLKVKLIILSNHKRDPKRDPKRDLIPEKLQTNVISSINIFSMTPHLKKQGHVHVQTSNKNV